MFIEVEPVFIEKTTGIEVVIDISDDKGNAVLETGIIIISVGCVGLPIVTEANDLLVPFEEVEVVVGSDDDVLVPW